MLSTIVPNNNDIGVKPVGATRSGEPPTLFRPSRNTLLLLAIVLLVSAWPFAGALQWLWEGWLGSPEYSHGIVIPALCAFLIWVRRDRLAEIPFTGSWAGVAVVVGAAIVYWLGKLATLHVIDNVGYWMLLCGIALSLMGSRAFRVIAVPMLLLVLAIPLPTFFLNNISSTLQLWSSQIGVAFIRMFGISVLLQGNVIDLGQYKLEVAEACSGLRYLFPLLTLGVLMGYLYQGALWKRVLIAMLSLPLTVLMNSLRVGSIGIMVDRWGPSLAGGFVHDFQGWAMFMLTGALMFGLLLLMHVTGPGGVSWQQAFGIPPPAVRPPGTVTQVSAVPTPFLATFAIVVALAAVGEFAPSPVDQLPPRTGFDAFPDHIGGWSGHRHGLESEYLDTLQLDDYLMSDYARPGDAVVNVYMNYYNTQRTGQSVHSPRSCLPGGGWVMTEFGQRDLPGLTVGGAPLRVNRAVIELGHERELVYYWFQQRGRILTSEFATKWYLMWDGLARHRTDGGLVRLVTPLPPGADVAAADARLVEFIRPLAAALPAYVPN